jgi:hypothetical protein
MKRKQWMIIAAGAFALTTAVCTVAVFAEDAPSTTTETNELSKLLEVLNGPKWNQFIEDTTNALKERAEDPEGRKETAEAIESGVNTLNEMVKRAAAIADALQHSTETPEFAAFQERVKQDLQSAAESLKEVDTAGLVRMLEAVSKEVVEPMGIVAEKAEEHFGDEVTNDEIPKPE